MNVFNSKVNVFTNRSSSDVITLKSGSGEILNLIGDVSTVSKAHYFIYNNTVVNTITATNVYYPVTLSDMDIDNNYNFSKLSNGYLKYTGLINGYFMINVIFAVSGHINDRIRIVLYKNDVIIPNLYSSDQMNSNLRINNLTLTTLLELSTGDTLRIYVTNLVSVNDILFEDINLIIIKV